MAKINKKYLAIVLLIVIGGSYYWYQKSNSMVAPVQYKTAVAEKGTLSTSVSGSGNVKVDKISNVDPTISGTVADLAVNAGDSVKKGQFLFNIINDDLSVSTAKAIASLQQAENSLDSAELNVKQAEADYDAARHDDSKTKKQKAILKEKISIAKSGVIASQKSLAATRADYNNQLSNASERKVVSPISATVIAVNIEDGDDLAKVSSSSTRQAPIIVGDLSLLNAYVQVNEVDIPNISIGQKAMLKFTAIDGLTISGKVEKMDSLGTIAQGVVTYNVTISFDTLDPRIRPEMSVSASIITGVKQDVIMVPNSAVKSQGNGYYVEILDDLGQSSQQKAVEVGASNNTDTEIISGINAGDKVITQTIDPKAATAAASSASGGLRLPGMGGGGGFRRD